MKAVFCTLLLFIFINGYGQTYVPTLGNTNEWYEMVLTWGIRTNVYKCYGDTIIKGKQYKFLTTDNYLYDDSIAGLIREDTAQKKIFILYKKDSTERVLYDFSLNIGDTIKTNNFYFNTNTYITLKAIEITENQGFKHKRLEFDVLNEQKVKVRPLFWVEGIGSLVYFLAPLYSNDTANYESGLNCFIKDSIKMYHNPYSPLSPEYCFINYNTHGFDKYCIFKDTGCVTSTFEMVRNSSFHFQLLNDKIVFTKSIEGTFIATLFTVNGSVLAKNSFSDNMCEFSVNGFDLPFIVACISNKEGELVHIEKIVLPNR